MQTMTVSVRTLELPLVHPFKIARGEETVARTALVRVRAGDLDGCRAGLAELQAWLDEAATIGYTSAGIGQWASALLVLVSMRTISFLSSMLSKTVPWPSVAGNSGLPGSAMVAMTVAQLGLNKDAVARSVGNVELNWQMSPQMVEEVKSYAEHMLALKQIRALPDFATLMDPKLSDQLAGKA